MYLNNALRKKLKRAKVNSKVIGAAKKDHFKWVHLKRGWRIWYYITKRDQSSFSLQNWNWIIKISWFNLYLYNSGYNCHFALIFRTNQQWIKCSLICTRNIFPKKIVLWHILSFKLKFHIIEAKRLVFVFHIHLFIFCFLSHFLLKAYHVPMLLLSSELSLPCSWLCMCQAVSQPIV